MSMYAETAKQFEWQVSVIKDDKTQNAFALPGKIAVYTGIFPVAQNEAGLAAILGHEVTHALARHGGERMSKASWPKEWSAATLGPPPKASVPKSLSWPGGALAQYGFILPYSRKHESEADYIGLLLAADAGYDPHEALHVWERMEQMSQGQPPHLIDPSQPRHTDYTD